MTDHERHAQQQFNSRLLRFGYAERRSLNEALSMLRSGSYAALQVQLALINLEASVDMLEAWSLLRKEPSTPRLDAARPMPVVTAAMVAAGIAAVSERSLILDPPWECIPQDHRAEILTAAYLAMAQAQVLD